MIMVSMQRRLNSTGRKRITRDRVTVELDPPLDKLSFPCAFVNINLNELDLDKTAAVGLEAYFRSSSMRFACGKVGDLNIPKRMHLTEIDRGGAIQFRLLVIAPDGSGRILASADGIKPARKNDSLERQSILPLRETDLGDQLWRIDIDDRTGPTLLINSRVPELAAQLRSTALLQGLVLPHALRAILQSLQSEGAEEGDDYWGDDWRKFLEQLDLPIEPEQPDDDESRHEWVEEAVTKFCSLKQFANRLRLETVKPDDVHA